MKTTISTSGDVNKAKKKDMPKLKPKIKAGLDRVKYKPLFSYDSRFLLVPSDTNVKVLSTVTGECIRDLVGHQSSVVTIMQNPKVQTQIYTCSENGEIISWDYEDGIILKRYRLRLHSPGRAFYASNEEGCWYVICKNKENFSLCFATVKNKKTKLKLLLSPVLPEQKCVSFSPVAEHVAAVKDTELRVLDISSGFFKKHYTGRRKLTCVCFHPSEQTLATGDEIGQILLWNDYLKLNVPSKSIYHWHTLPVADLAFSDEGNFLYSGGEECVLVKWKMGTETRYFLPRMGFPIKHVTVSARNEYVASSHVDNGIYLINSQNKVERIFQGLTLNCFFNPKDELASNILLYDQKNHSLVLNGKPGSLQFYNPNEDCHLFSVDVVGENFISVEKMHIANTFIDRADIDSEGRWLATVEYRDDNETSQIIRLKFWKYIEESQKYQLNTNIFLPHTKRIKSIKFRSLNELNTPMAVTTSDDKSFKLWVLSANDEEGKKESWNYFSLGYYHELIPNVALFSGDGSILAVAFEHIVTLWDSETNMSLKNLYVKSEGEIIQQMFFGQELCSHLLVCLTEENLTVWNLLTLSVLWDIPVKGSSLAMDPVTGIMSYFDDQNTLFVFRPDNKNSIYTQKNASKEKVVSSVFLPHTTPLKEEGWQQYSQLYFMNMNQELMILSEETESVEKPNSMVLPKYEFTTPFAKLVAEHRFSEKIDSAKYDNFDQEGIVGAEAYSMISEIPSHIVPPASVLCFGFLSSMASPIKQ